MFIEYMHLITENMSTTKCLESQDGVEREKEKDSRYVFMLSYKADFEEEIYIRLEFQNNVTSQH